MRGNHQDLRRSAKYYRLTYAMGRNVSYSLHNIQRESPTAVVPWGDEILLVGGEVSPGVCAPKIWRGKVGE